VKSIKILIVCIIIIAILTVTYRLHSEIVFKYLSCNDIFEPRIEAFNDFAYENANYKFYIWQSDRLVCGHEQRFENRIIEFINDSTALIYTKSYWLENTKFLFTLKYFLGINEFNNKEYNLYKIKEDTLFRSIDKENYDQYNYIWDADSIHALEIPPNDFKPYKEFATFAILNQKLILSEFNRKR